MRHRYDSMLGLAPDSPGRFSIRNEMHGHGRCGGLRRRGITSSRQAALVTLGYSEVVISLRKLRYQVRSAELSQRLLRAPQKPHNSATQCLIPTRIPRTKRHTPVHL
jgi:hypothetical protein